MKPDCVAPYAVMMVLEAKVMSKLFIAASVHHRLMRWLYGARNRSQAHPAMPTRSRRGGHGGMAAWGSAGWGTHGRWPWPREWVR